MKERLFDSDKNNEYNDFKPNYNLLDSLVHYCLILAPT